MIGIKECLNWMVDNPMKEIKTEGIVPHRFNEERGVFEFKNRDRWDICSEFIFLKRAGWEEVKRTYTFQEAADICRETGKRFKGEYNDMMNRNPEGEVYVWSLDGGDVVIDSEWTEV